MNNSEKFNHGSFLFLIFLLFSTSILSLKILKKVNIQNIRIAGSELFSQNDVIDNSSLKIPIRLIFINTSYLEKELKQNLSLKNVSVSRRILPFGLKVYLKTRTPIAFGEIILNDEMTIHEVDLLPARSIIISPGPGRPKDAGVSVDVVKKFHNRVPILGVCLGHQVIGEAFGGKIGKIREDQLRVTRQAQERFDKAYANAPQDVKDQMDLLGRDAWNEMQVEQFKDKNTALMRNVNRLNDIEIQIQKELAKPESQQDPDLLRQLQNTRTAYMVGIGGDE